MNTPSTSRAPALDSVLRPAAGVMATVLQGHTPEARLDAVDPALRPAVRDAVFGTLRSFGRGDFILGRLMQRPLEENGEPLIRALLLLALHRLERDPASAHTTVNQTVSAAEHLQSGRFKGLVNGVLRNFLRQREPLLTAAEANEVARWQHPDWWLRRLRQDQPEHWQAIASAGNSHPPMSLRVNRRRLTATEFCAHLNSAGIAHELGSDETIYLPQPLPVSRLPGFAEGDCSVQDAGAQRAARLLDVRSGMRVLDACAAPGGKAAHLLELAEIELLALDAERARAGQVAANFSRLGLQGKVQVADARQPESWWDGKAFARILADVPCSASGVVRRHPDAKWLRREQDIAGFAATQAQILDALWQTLAPGGKMLYATCSVFDQENSAQVARFLDHHPDAALATNAPEKELTLLPNDRQDGFFYALLEKS